MIIRDIELREIRLPLIHFFETSFGRTTERNIILVRVVDQDGAEGWGECTAGEGPFYSNEWVDAAWSTMQTFLAPLVVGKEVSGAHEIWSLMRPVRGHRMAKAAIENACWDLEAKRAGVPLWRHLGGVNTEIACGVSIGIQNSPEELLAKIEKEVAAGYQRIKIKIKPGWDLKIVELVRKHFPDIRLMGDANSAYSLKDVELFKALDQFQLMMFEQPLAHNDIFDHAELQRQVNTPVCLDESIRCPEDARHALQLGSCRIINVKLGRVGGHTEAKRVEQICREHKIPVWCGGMLESGIGRAHNIAMSTLAGFTLPGDVSASARYWEEDIIEPPVTVSATGTIAVPDGPGIGFTVNKKRIDRLTLRREYISKDHPELRARFAEVLSAVCKRPEMYGLRTFGEVIAFLDGYAKNRKLGERHYYFSGFDEWLQQRNGKHQRGWEWLEAEYPVDGERIKELPRLWSEYEQSQ